MPKIRKMIKYNTEYQYNGMLAVIKIMILSKLQWQGKILKTEF